MVQHEIGIIVAFAALITAVVAFASIHYLKKQLVISEEASNDSRKAYEDSRKSYEIDSLLRFKEKLLDKDFAELMKRSLRLDEPVLKPNGGPIEEITLYLALGVINDLKVAIDLGIISEDVVIRTMGGIIADLYEHKDVQTYIKNDQERLGTTEVWSGVVDLAEKFTSFQKNQSKKDTKS